jgi:hypothetical protein
MPAPFCCWQTFSLSISHIPPFAPTTKTSYSSLSSCCCCWSCCFCFCFCFVVAFVVAIQWSPRQRLDDDNRVSTCLASQISSSYSCSDIIENNEPFHPCLAANMDRWNNVADVLLVLCGVACFFFYGQSQHWRL